MTDRLTERLAREAVGPAGEMLSDWDAARLGERIRAALRAFQAEAVRTAGAVPHVCLQEACCSRVIAAAIAAL
jgi:hypothetical protein